MDTAGLRWVKDRHDNRFTIRFPWMIIVNGKQIGVELTEGRSTMEEEESLQLSGMGMAWLCQFKDANLLSMSQIFQTTCRCFGYDRHLRYVVF
jgi:hypothetical protein